MKSIRIRFDFSNLKPHPRALDSKDLVESKLQGIKVKGKKEEGKGWMGGGGWKKQLSQKLPIPNRCKPWEALKPQKSHNWGRDICPPFQNKS